MCDDKDITCTVKVSGNFNMSTLGISLRVVQVTKFLSHMGIPLQSQIGKNHVEVLISMRAERRSVRTV